MNYVPVPEHAFHKEVLVRFRDCDPAGIVFYPRYLEMFNNLVEDWFREGLELSFSELINEREWGIPTVHINVDFISPSRMGEKLNAYLWVRRLGRSSIHMAIHLQGPDGSNRVVSDEVLVFTNLRSNRARAIPEELIHKMSRFSIDVEPRDTESPEEEKVNADS
jgi:4-hydroxybenzoyl-CoA thioesterase